jgi:hypothetical protein
MDLEKLIASSLRQKILKELSKIREIRMMQLVYRTGGTYNEVNRNLKILEIEGIIVNDYRNIVKHSTVRVIFLNKENPRTRILIQVLKELEVENGASCTLA